MGMFFKTADAKTSRKIENIKKFDGLTVKAFKGRDYFLFTQHRSMASKNVSPYSKILQFSKPFPKVSKISHTKNLKISLAIFLAKPLTPQNFIQ